MTNKPNKYYNKRKAVFNNESKTKKQFYKFVLCKPVQ